MNRTLLVLVSVCVILSPVPTGADYDALPPSMKAETSSSLHGAGSRAVTEIIQAESTNSPHEEKIIQAKGVVTSIEIPFADENTIVICRPANSNWTPGMTWKGVRKIDFIHIGLESGVYSFFVAGNSRVGVYDVIVDGDDPKPKPKPDPDPDPKPKPKPKPKPDDPDEPVIPPAPDDTSKLFREWLKAVPSKAYSKEKAEALAANYESVAGQVNATKNTISWNIRKMSDALKPLNVEALGIENVEDWRDGFFVPLVEWQVKKGLREDDVSGHVETFFTIAESIRKAAF